MPDDSDILIVYDGKIALVGSDLSYIILKEPYAAIGVADHAEGTLSANFKKDPYKNISLAIKAASKSNAGVSVEHTVLEEEQSDENT